MRDPEVTQNSAMADHPSWGELARTALADARVATLVTGECADPSTPTIVRVDAGVEARPRFWLEPSSPTVARLSRWPVATLVVAASPPFRSLALTGAVRSPAHEGSSCPPFELVPTAARLLGARAASIDLEEFLHAEPDPLRGAAPAIVRHLEVAHAAELLACVRAHGHADAVAVVPHGLNRYGIDLTMLTPDGVQCVWLAFSGGPVDRLHDVGPGLRPLLMCRCRERSTQ